MEQVRIVGQSGGDDSLRAGDMEEIEKAHALIVCHGQTQKNAGLHSDSIYDELLTNKGERQAEHLADFLPSAPTRIILSPSLRTKLTANAIISKFPRADVSEWPIQDFTILNPDKHQNLSEEDRELYIQRYWQDANPQYRDGGVAESFMGFWQRVKMFREGISRLVPGALVITHGQFMRMIKLQEIYEKPDRNAMDNFHMWESRFQIAHTARIAMAKSEYIDFPKASHLPPDLITY